MRNDDIRQLLEHTDTTIKSIEISINNGTLNKVLLKNTLENLRSALDYLAKDILAKLKKKNKSLSDKIYFPYGQKEKHFKRSVQNNLPTLKQDLPRIYTLLESIQPYISKNNWVVDLCSLTNDAKHNGLSKTEYRKETVVVQPGIRIVGGSNNVIRDNYYNGVRQDDVYTDDNGGVRIVKHSDTTFVTHKDRIIFHGKELEIIPFLTSCHKEIIRLIKNIAPML